MEKYDSSIETKKHIKTVGKYIDIICKNLINKNDMTNNISNLTLIDLLITLSNKQILPSYERIFTSINDNSYKTVPFISNSLNQQQIIDLFILELQKRKELHDKSKLEEPEKSEFDIWTPKLAGSTYGSEKYKTFLIELKKALEHHYKNNRHHPEHFINGIYGMNIIDITEMFCDWRAASERHNDGDIFKSSEINEKRFGYGPTLTKVLMNTADKFFK